MFRQSCSSSHDHADDDDDDLASESLPSSSFFGFSHDLCVTDEAAKVMQVVFNMMIFVSSSRFSLSSQQSFLFSDLKLLVFPQWKLLWNFKGLTPSKNAVHVEFCESKTVRY